MQNKLKSVTTSKNNFTSNKGRAVNIKLPIVSIYALLLSAPTFAASVEFDTPDAHIIIMRSIDSWSGDTTAPEDSLEAVAKHEVGFSVYRDKGNELGYPMLIQGISKDVVVQGVNSALIPLKFRLKNTLPFMFNVGKAATINPKEYNSFTSMQRELYKSDVIANGDPSSLPKRISRNKIFGGVLSFVVVALV